MEIKKFEIDEKQAEAAKTMNSFSDYKEGSATNEYYSYLKKFAENVEDLRSVAKVKITPEIEEAIEYYSNRYSYKLAEAKNKEYSIEAMCPSVMICGAGNFPVRKKQKQNLARENWWAKYNDLFNENNYYMRKIKNLLMNTTIYSNDELVIEKLQDRIAELEENQQMMKDVNAYYKKNGNLNECDILPQDIKRKVLINMQFHTWDNKPFASYELTNNNADIRRNKERLEQVQKLKARAEQNNENKYQKVDGVEVVEDANDMRIRLIFEEIPDIKTRELLKHNGFKWSPKNSAWQRQLTANGIWSTKQVLKQLGENK